MFSHQPVVIFAHMLTRKCIVGFFILLFSFQLAPVQQVGSFLYNNQMTEEIPHGQDDSGAKYADDSLKHFFQSLSDLGEHEQAFEGLLRGKAVDIKIITRSFDDIQTPPPNNFV